MRRFTLIELLLSIAVLSITVLFTIMVISHARKPTEPEQPKPVFPTIQAETFQIDYQYYHLNRIKTPFGWLVIRKDEMIHILDPNHVWNPIEVE